jgi:FkbM family methyltransferase
MGLYGQEAEVRLLGRLMTRLDEPSLLDVGAEQGSLTEAMLDAGAQQLHAIEPHPDNARALRARFAADRRVVVHELAVGDGDGSAELHVSSSPDGGPLPFGHTLLQRANTHEIAWNEVVSVPMRSLGSLIDAGELPRRFGILKIDTEGNDLSVVRGMGVLEADVVMVEHWTDLPNGLGPCPWTAAEMLAELRPRGFAHFAFIVHRREFVTLKWDDGEVERGAMGNLVFLHERVLAPLMHDVLDLAGQLAEEAVRAGERYERAAGERLALLNRLEGVAEDRLAMVKELEGVAEDRLAIVKELEETADERLQALEATTAKMRSQAAELESLGRSDG